jgi:cellobiose dehydrogenase (acceptor)
VPIFLFAAFSDPIEAVRASAQDFATHGLYTEPNTGITFYTASETNGTITGDGELSTVSWGGFTFGLALPPTALTVDTHEYIGLIVSFPSNRAWFSIAYSFRSVLLPPAKEVGPELCTVTTCQQAC